MEILNYELARRLAKNNEVILYSQRGLDQKKNEYEQGLLHRRFTFSLDRLYLFISSIMSRHLPSHTFTRTHVQKKPFFASIFYYLIYYLQIALDCRVQQFDIIHIHNLSQFLPIFKFLNPNSKIVLHMHIEWLNQLDKEMVIKRIKNVDLILSCSEYITNKIRNEFPQLKEKCKTLHNGVDINRFTARHHDNLKNMQLLFVGRNSPEKGLHVLIETFQNIVIDNPNVKLNIVGPLGSAPVMRGRELILYLSNDPNVLKLESYYNENYLSNIQKTIIPQARDRIFYFGFISRVRLIEAYANAQLFVFPSIWGEPFGMPIVEGMAMSLPVIASKVGGIPEIVEDGKTGILVPPGDEKALREAIQLLISNEGLRRSMGVSARNRVENNFSWDKLTEKLQHYYESVL